MTGTTSTTTAGEQGPAYDVNFCFHVPQVLESDRVKLVPFIPTIHAAEFFSEIRSSPHVYDYLPYGPFPTLRDYHQFLETRITNDPGTVLFAVYDTSQRNSDILAGCVSYLNSSAPHLTVEIGHIVTLPAFQRSHVTSNAIGLLLRYALDLPSAGGLGLRRVLWKAYALNERSIKAAQRMGFQWEALMRWDRVLPMGKEKAGNGIGDRAEDPKRGRAGRDTVVLGFCWDDWQAGGRQRVSDVMARRV